MYVSEKYSLKHTRDAQNISFQIGNQFKIKGIYDYIESIKVECNYDKYLATVEVVYEFDTYHKVYKESYDISEINDFSIKRTFMRQEFNCKFNNVK
jgi:hypothetical protein